MDAVRNESLGRKVAEGKRGQCSVQCVMLIAGDGDGQDGLHCPQ